MGTKGPPIPREQTHAQTRQYLPETVWGGQKQKAEDIMSGVLVRLVKYHLKLYNPRQMLPRIEETIIIGSSKTKRDKETNSRIFPSLPFG